MVRKLYNYEKDIHGLKRDLSAQTDSRIMYQERNDELQLHKKKLENMVVRSLLTSSPVQTRCS